MDIGLLDTYRIDIFGNNQPRLEGGRLMWGITKGYEPVDPTWGAPELIWSTSDPTSPFYYQEVLNKLVTEGHDPVYIYPMNASLVEPRESPGWIEFTKLSNLTKLMEHKRSDKVT